MDLLHRMRVELNCGHVGCVGHDSGSVSVMLALSFKLCRERLSDDTSERSLSHGFSRGLNTICVKNEVFAEAKNAQENEPLANACANWLLVLYYEGSPLKD